MVRSWAALVAYSAAMGMGVSCHAEQLISEVRLGVLSQGAGIMNDDKEDGLSLNGEILFRSPEILKPIGAPRLHMGTSVATDRNATSQIYGGLTWEKRFSQRYFISGGFGFAVHNAETGVEPPSEEKRGDEGVFLGCRALFRFSADAGYLLTKRLSVAAHFEHISNANLCDENEGLDNSGIRLGYRF